MLELGDCHAVFRRQSVEVRRADSIDQGQHAVEDDRLDHVLEDVTNELITLAIHLLLQILHFSLLFNLRVSQLFFSIFFFLGSTIRRHNSRRRTLNLTTAPLQLVEQFPTLGELHLAHQINNPTRI